MNEWSVTLDESERRLLMRLLTEDADRNPGDPQNDSAWMKLNLAAHA